MKRFNNRVGCQETFGDVDRGYAKTTKSLFPLCIALDKNVGCLKWLDAADCVHFGGMQSDLFARDHLKNPISGEVTRALN